MSDTPRVVLVGDGIVASPTDYTFDSASSTGKLPPKVEGQHRWIATAGFTLTDAMAAEVDNSPAPRSGWLGRRHRPGLAPDAAFVLDHKRLFHLAIGCWDCEQELGQVKVGSRCPTRAADCVD